MNPRSRAAAVGGLLALLGLARPAGAQLVLDWPARTSSIAEAVLPGAAAAFWNPAAITALDGRLEALVADIEGPDATGLGGVALAVAWQPRTPWALALGYQHLQIEGIVRTTTTPMADSLDPAIDFAQELITLSAASTLPDGLAAGISFRYTWTNHGPGRQARALLGAGLIYRASLPFDPEIGGALLLGHGGAEWRLGASAALRPAPDLPWNLQLSYGIAGQRWPTRPEHRFALATAWGQRLEVAAGLDAQPGPGFTAWQPVLSGSLRLGRYLLGVVREELANDFGAGYTFRFQASF
ncbi:MAG: hypothetical protein HY703_13340 [Gemmatimonadetes bacterium]|nr:hypothetical protein [Gemmatimonadota bacterium]